MDLSEPFHGYSTTDYLLLDHQECNNNQQDSKKFPDMIGVNSRSYGCPCVCTDSRTRPVHCQKGERDMPEDCMGCSTGAMWG